MGSTRHTHLSYNNNNTMLELHAFPASSPSRAVHMTLDLLGLEYTYTSVNILEGEQNTPEFLAMNPQHTVPVLCDGNLTITESRAAMAYLVSQHKPGQLYPACAKKRSQIDQRLQFGIGTFWARIVDCALPVCLGKTTTIPQEKIDALKEALMWANQMVTLPSSQEKSHKMNSSKILSNTFHDLLCGGKKKVSCGYVLGNSLTIADIDFLASYSSLEACGFLSLKPYKSLLTWSQTMKQQIPKYSENCGAGAAVFGNWFKGNYKPEN